MSEQVPATASAVCSAKRCEGEPRQPASWVAGLLIPGSRRGKTGGRASTGHNLGEFVLQLRRIMYGDM